MPAYDFNCPECGKPLCEITLSIHEDVPTPKCCGGPMDRVYGSRGFSTGYSVPILSDALGVMPNQVAEARTLHPDREYTPDGRLVMRSHQDRNRYLREDGFHDNN